MTDITEAVARAICETLFGFYDENDDSPSSCLGQSRLAARAAIAAAISEERERAERAEQLAYDLKLAAAGGEDAPGAAEAVTVADVARWQRGSEAAVRHALARAERAEAELAAEREKAKAKENAPAVEPGQ